MVEAWLQDMTYALRTLVRNPGFTAIAIVMLGLGLSANIAVFSVFHAVLIRPLPYGEPERIALVFEDASFAKAFPRTRRRPPTTSIGSA